MKRKTQLILGIILAFVALGAIPAGLSMINHPDGSRLGMTLDLLKNSSFHDFLIPGLFLFIVNGIFNLAGAILCFMKNRFAGISGLFLGVMLVIWICIQVYSVSLNSFMQPVFFGIGILEIVLSVLIIKESRR